MIESFELRTLRNRPVFSFDSLTRAKEERARAEKRIGVSLKIVKITRTEQEVM